MSGGRVRASALAAAVALAGTLVPWAADAKPKPKSQAKPLRTYVALGDSYASGPLIPAQVDAGCQRSSNNYAALLADRLGLELTDATCSGARTTNMTSPQAVDTWPTPNPPQFDRLERTTDLVTLQVGGNDVGFVDIAVECGTEALQAKRCSEHFASQGGDRLDEAIARAEVDVDRVLDGIRQRSPRARVLVLGYPSIFRHGGAASCPAMGYGEDDARYLRSVEEKLNAALARTARANGAEYVDTYGPSAGRTACDLPGFRWVEPLAPVNAAMPIHPNLNGMLGVTDLLEQVLAPNVLSDSDLEAPAVVSEAPPVTSPFSYVPAR